MVSTITQTHNPKSGLESRRRNIRAALIMKGHTLASFARSHGVSDPLVHRLIAGERPGRSGKSRAVRAALEAAAGGAKR